MKKIKDSKKDKLSFIGERSAIEFFIRGSFTMASAILEDYSGSKFIGIGFSKCNLSVDIYDPERGAEIAKGRALKDLMNQFNKLTGDSERGRKRGQD